MNKREIICGIIFVAAFISLLGLTGEADLGGIGFAEYMLRGTVHLVVMGVCVIVGDEEAYRALFPSRKKNRRR